MIHRNILKTVSTPNSLTIVNVPPRHGKSVLVSQYTPAWILGKWPDKNVILGGYEARFAASWGRKARDVLDRWGEPVFGVRVRQDLRAADRWEVAGHSGGMMTAGVGGAFTGYGFHIGIIDDSLKNSEEALSKTIRDKQWDWYQSTWLTRREPGASEFIIATRWHADDLTGRIIADARETGRPINHIRLAALAEDDDELGRKPGEALWPERYPVKRLKEIERTLGFWFPALYQQRPVPMGGALFKAEWFTNTRFAWLGTPGGECEGYRLRTTGRSYRAGDCPRFMIVDPSLGKKDAGDPQGFGVFAVTPTDQLLTLRAKSMRIHFERLVDEIADWYETWRPDFIGMEANGFQVLLAREARANPRIRCPIREIDPKGKSKLVRGIPAVETAANGNVFVPDEDWVAPFIEELTEWTGAEDDRDDRVDILSYAVMELLTVRNQVDDVDRRPAVGRPRYGVR